MKAAIRKKALLAVLAAGMSVLLAVPSIGAQAGQNRSAPYGLSDPDNIGAHPDRLNDEVYPIPDYFDVVLRAADFGVTADDRRDDTLAMEAVMQEAKASSDAGLSVHIVLPEGQLDFIEGKSPTHPNVGIYFEDLHHVVLSGRSTLMFHGEIRPIEMLRSKDVLIHGITIDYGRPPFSMGTLTASDGKVLEVTVDHGYPVDERVKVDAILEFDPGSSKPRADGNDIYGNVKQVKYLGDQKLRIELVSPVDIAPVGTVLVLRHYIYDLDGITAKDSEQLRFESVTIHTAPGMGFVGYSSSDLYFNRFNIVLPAGSDRLMTTTADGLHFSDCDGEIVVTNSIFENLGDDALNVHGFYLVIDSKLDAHSLNASNPRGYNFPPKVGDVVELSRATALLPALSAKVTAVERSASGPGYRITLDQPIPDEIVAGDVLANATRAAKLTFQNNIVRNKRSRGILIQTRDALVENNTFANIANIGVLVTTEALQWFESIGSRDVAIRNNKFVGNNYDKSRAYGDITTIALVKNYAYGPSGIFRNFVIENNFFAETGNAGIFIFSADGVDIRSNMMHKTGLWARDPSFNAGIGLSNSANITLQGNDIIANGSQAFKPVYVGAGVEAGSITARDNRGFDEEIVQGR